MTLTLPLTNDMRRVLVWGYRWRQWALDVEKAAAPWAGDE